MVEKLVDWLKSLPEKFLEWWKKFTSKQKTAIILATLGVVIAFAILITVVTRTQYTALVTCDNTTQASEVKDLLDANDIKYHVSDNGLVFTVDKKQLSDANLLLGANSIMADSYSDLSSVVNGGLSTTESDKEKLYTAYKENKIKRDLENLSFVNTASVTLNIPENNGTLIASKEPASAQVMLKLQGECPEDKAAYIARAVATAIGNDSTDKVVIMDTNGNMLFAGGDATTSMGYAGSQLSIKQEAENTIKNEVKKVLMNTNEFDLIEVGTALTLDFSNTEKVTTTYTPADGQTQGVLSHETNYEAQTDGGVGLIPGTDSNIEQTYVYESGGAGSSTVSQYEKDYLPNTETTTKIIPAGLIVYDQSSIAVTAIHYNVIKEEDAKKQGLLDGIKWDEYKLLNNTRTKMEVDADLVSVISDASGIDTSNITLVAYEEPFFVDKEKKISKISWTDVLQVILIVVILFLLAYVVLRSLKSDKKKVEEEPEELSVESMLQSLPQTDSMEDIELNEKSEARILIEKFVDENPEAVASLLRNWLSEDWG